MHPLARAGRKFPSRALNSFTIVEMLVVIGIIAILAALTLGAFGGAKKASARNRAKSEIKAFETAVESYKADNGSYPLSDGSLLLTNNYTSPPTGLSYITNATILYQALTGKTNYTDTGGGKAYMNLASSQVGNRDGSAPGYVIDPWGYAYGYSTGNLISGTVTSAPYNGGTSFDLWSTGSDLTGNTNIWITNFQ